MLIRVIKTDKSTCSVDWRKLKELLSIGLVAVYHDGARWIPVKDKRQINPYRGQILVPQEANSP